MNQNFQILRDNNDGTFDIEVTTFVRVTVTHPTAQSGAKLTGSSLTYFMNNWAIDNFPNTTGSIDSSASSFAVEYELDQPFNIAEVLPELLPVVEVFPLNYDN